ncbi:MAG: YicC family protein [Alphaproteobacteria bacterium]|nr:YicC family protein [Alphaproteobacteria bacterium]
MTGFARAAGEQGPWQWAWEVKSVNARALDIRFRTPQGHDRLEMAGREAVSKIFKRGSFNLSLSVQRGDAGEGDRPMRINKPLLDQLVAEASRYGGKVADEPPRIETLMTVRGVVEPIEAPEDEAVVGERMSLMLQSLVQALTALNAARREEGGRLKAVLHGQLDELAKFRMDAASADATRPQKIVERLRTQIAELLADTKGLTEDRMHQEVALMIAKGDIREELDRLDAHIASARELLDAGDAVGRRLDFLCQEMTREANTLCSKSGDIELTRVGLAMKAKIEQFREQVQNVE